MKKTLNRGLLVIYLVIIIWLVLFKFKLDISPLIDYENRIINLIPFAAPIPPFTLEPREVLYNCLIFIPFGLLLSINLKKVKFWHKLAYIMAFSLTLELIQYIFAIGAMDITDLITNTFGGFIGLKLYDLSKRYIHNEKLDKMIIFFGITLLIFFIIIFTNILSQRL